MSAYMSRRGYVILTVGLFLALTLVFNSAAALESSLLPEAVPTILSSTLAPPALSLDIETSTQLSSGCDGTYCVFPVAKSSDDAGPNPVYDCDFSTDWNEIFLGECYDGTDITSGFRFPNITLPQGTQVVQAYLEFTVDGPYTDELTLALYGEDTGNAEPFTITNQPKDRTVMDDQDLVVAWHIPASDRWELNSVQRTPDLTAIVQTVLNRPNWEKGNALAIIVKNAGSASGLNRHRRVVGYDRPATTYNGFVPRLVIIKSYESGATTITVPITSGIDDAGERSDCIISFSSPEIYLGACDYRSGYNYPIISGFRFRDVSIPQGAIIKEAHLEFTADGPYNNDIFIVLYGHRSANSGVFSFTDFPRDRFEERTEATVNWNISDTWTSGETRSIPDLSPIIQELVLQKDWNSSSPLTILADGWSNEQGTNRRIFAWERENSSACAARLIVTYEDPPPLASDIIDLFSATEQDIQDITDLSEDVCTVGDFFLNKLSSPQVNGVVNVLFLGLFELPGVNWSRVGIGLDRVIDPGFSVTKYYGWWHHWIEDAPSRRWYKTLYDVLHDTPKNVLWHETFLGGFKHYAGEGAEKLTTDGLKTWLGNTLTQGFGEPISDEMCDKIKVLAKDHQSALIQGLVELWPSLPTRSLTPDQVEAYRKDLLKRQEASSQIVAHLTAHRDLIWDSYQEARKVDIMWVMGALGKFLVKEAIILAFDLGADGPGVLVAQVATEGLEILYEYVRDVRAQDHNEKMVDSSLRFLGPSKLLAYQQVFKNAVNSSILYGEQPQIGSGEASVIPGSIKTFYERAGIHAFLTSSQLELNINNTPPTSTTYLTFFSYRNIDNIPVLRQGPAFELAGETEETVVFEFASKEWWGESPVEGNPVNLLVLGFTGTGMYPVTSFEFDWTPRSILLPTELSAQIQEQNVTTQANESPILPYPLHSVIANVPGTTEYQGAIFVSNPFTMTSSATVTQTIPASFEILDAGDAQVIGETLVWTDALEPGAWLELQSRLSWEETPGELISVPGPELTLQDPDTGDLLNFAAPAENVPAAWPLATSFDLPLIWRLGAPVSIQAELTNFSTSLTAQGLFTGTLTALEDKVLWSATQPVNVPAGETQSLSWQVQVSARTGYAVLSGELSLGDARRQVLLELIDFCDYRIYFPLISR